MMRNIFIAFAFLLALCGPAPAATFTNPGTLTQDPDWVTGSHDFARTNVQLSSGGITTATVSHLKLLWTYHSAASYDVAGPIELGGVVYVVDIAGNLVALKASTGTPLWHLALGAQVKMTPALLGGRLYVATHVASPATATSTLYSLDPATGAIQWQEPLLGGVVGSPALVGRQLYVPVAIGDRGFCHPGGVYVFDAQTGAAGFEWLTEPSQVSDGGGVWSSVTYDGAHLLFGSGNTCRAESPRGNAIVALNIYAGFLWANRTASSLTDDDVGGSASFDGTRAYISAKNGLTYAFDPSTGSYSWARRLGAPDGLGGFSTPASTGATVVTSGGFPADPYKSNPGITNYGMLYGLDATDGAVKWKVSAVAPFWAPVALTPGLAFTTVDANLTALDPASGHTLWETPLVGYSRTQPIVAQGNVFVADQSGRLYAFALPTAGNAAQRAGVRNLLSYLPRHHVVPFDPHVPSYCRSFVRPSQSEVFP